jgi:hypothetical protein
VSPEVNEIAFLHEMTFRSEVVSFHEKRTLPAGQIRLPYRMALDVRPSLRRDVGPISLLPRDSRRD